MPFIRTFNALNSVKRPMGFKRPLVQIQSLGPKKTAEKAHRIGLLGGFRFRHKTPSISAEFRCITPPVTPRNGRRTPLLEASFSALSVHAGSETLDFTSRSLVRSVRHHRTELFRKVSTAEIAIILARILVTGIPPHGVSSSIPAASHGTHAAIVAVASIAAVPPIGAPCIRSLRISR